MFFSRRFSISLKNFNVVIFLNVRLLKCLLLFEYLEFFFTSMLRYVKALYCLRMVFLHPPLVASRGRAFWGKVFFQNDSQKAFKIRHVRHSKYCFVDDEKSIWMSLRQELHEQLNMRSLLVSIAVSMLLMNVGFFL